MSKSVIGGTIKWIRRSQGLSQRELAKRIGVSFQYLSKWERDIKSPTAKSIIRIADALGVATDYIFTGGIAMGKKSDGGPAFPRRTGAATVGAHVYFNDSQKGMSLRAYLAGQALAGWDVSQSRTAHVPVDEIAIDCLDIADALISELDKGK